MVQNVWELSGLFEGDIMLDTFARNGLLNPDARWPFGVVPYHISSDFSDYEKAVIMSAVSEYHEKTCVRFRAYRKCDHDWVDIRGDRPGCWSYVGRRGGGQVLNLAPGCIHHGVIVHELMHALGFFHQQSAVERDDYVQIIWDNIRKGTENNFKKRSITDTIDYGIKYDYGSIMHYSRKAFSKNGNDTIVPKDPEANIGQRGGMSDKDVAKVRNMYLCHEDEQLTEEKQEKCVTNMFDQFVSILTDLYQDNT
ncbi:zinc metalloproteinase nas-13 isoform X2 [Bemisia tabaci]